MIKSVIVSMDLLEVEAIDSNYIMKDEAKSGRHL
jgi:hypothetical protein